MSCTMLLVLSPVFILLWVILKFHHGGTAFFAQARPGMNGKVFYILKFKTMSDAVDDHGNLLPDEHRITWIGKIIRNTSLDEIPQLINVIKGDMSMVGPRPLLREYLVLYSKEQSRRHDVRPGVTGWAQINGRNAISWEKKFKYDLWYVDHYNFLLDWKILFITLFNVLLGKGITQQGHVSSGKFQGKQVKA